MSTPFTPYAPHEQSAVEVIQYARRAIDEMTRSNPLQNAVVSSGLIKWLGNYTNLTNPDKVNFLWIGEFLPLDPVMGKAQRGFSLVRDDSRQGVSALALFDPSPNAGGSGLRQILIITSGDNKRLFEEAREGGQRFPEETMWLGPIGDSAAVWPGTNQTTFAVVWEGRASIVGNKLRYRTFCYNEAGVSSEHRMRVTSGATDLVGPTHTIGAGAQNVFEDEVDVTAFRGTTVVTRWESRLTVTSGTNRTRSSIISARCYTP